MVLYYSIRALLTVLVVGEFPVIAKQRESGAFGIYGKNSQHALHDFVVSLSAPHGHSTVLFMGRAAVTIEAEDGRREEEGRHIKH